MPLSRITDVLRDELERLSLEGRAKGKEFVIVDVKKPQGKKGPRFLLKGYGDREFIRMNSNSYLGMSLKDEIIKIEEEAARKYGVGPGAVRFISGTYFPHRELEKTRTISFKRRCNDIQRSLCNCYRRDFFTCNR